VLAPQYARGTRAAILAERHSPADAARAMAIPPLRIVHPPAANSLSPTLTVMAMDTRLPSWSPPG
jgi:hypothetical protein